MPRNDRSAYTLIEVLLALGIAVLLMAALYVAVDVQLRAVQEGRERVDQATLTRAIVTRMSADLRAAIGPLTAPTLTSESSTESTTASAPAAGETAGTTAAADAEIPLTNLNAGTSFASGVIGDTEMITIYATTARGLRRITYLMTDLGLARAEDADVAADVDPFAIADEFAQIIAPEVIALQFEYFDGSGWLSMWDGSIPGSDGTTPIGPPRAIAVTLEIVRPGRADTVLIRQVIAPRTPGGGVGASVP